MKYCRFCGAQLMDEAVMCPNCGCAQGAIKTDSSSFGYGLLGFCIPIVGLILYLVWKNDTPLKAKSAGKGALISVICSFVIYLIYFVFLAALLS